MRAQGASLPYTPKLFLGSFIQITKTFHFNTLTKIISNQPVLKLGASNIKYTIEAEEDTFNLVEIIVALNIDRFPTNL